MCVCVYVYIYIYIYIYIIRNILTNRVRKKGALHIVKVESNILYTINRKKGNWLLKAHLGTAF
jgi:hypothetical protein